MNRFFALSLFCVLALAAGLPARAEEKTDGAVVTLRQALAAGINGHPRVNAASDNRRATDETLNQARAGYRPTVGVSADTGYEWVREDPAGATGATTANLFRNQETLTLTQMLFDGFETSNSVAQQRARVASSAYRVWETSEFLGLDIVEAYLEVLRQRELLAIARANVDRHREIEKQIADSSSAGRTTQADVAQVKARAAVARAGEASVREALRTAEATYNSRVGDMPRTLERPVSPIGYLAQTINEEVRDALTRSPTLAARGADTDAAEAEWRQTGAAFMPRLDLRADATQARNTSGVEGSEESARALLTLNWNLYRGGADSARMREGAYRHAQARSTAMDTARSVEEDVRQTWARMISAHDRAGEFDKQAEASAAVVTAYLDQFSLDRRTLLDVLDSQSEHASARSNGVNARYLELFAIYRLLALKGALLPAFDVALPQESDPNKVP